jgi:hypothetical protein
MRIALIELHVDVSRRPRSASEVADGDAVTRALRARPDERNALALQAIEVAGSFEPEIIVCPGWTFVGWGPRAASLSRAAGKAVLLYEVLAGGERSRRRRRDRGTRQGGRAELPWRTHVLEDGAVRKLPTQTFVSSGELDDAGSDCPTRLAAALRDGRSVAGAVVLVCGEVNAVRRQVQAGASVRHGWDERVRSAGILDGDLADAVVLNPAHTPAGSYVREKRRAGPWRAIVSTANTLDRSRIGKPALASPAHAVVDGRDQEPSLEPAAVDAHGSRVVIHDLAIA